MMITSEEELDAALRELAVGEPPDSQGRAAARSRLEHEFRVTTASPRSRNWRVRRGWIVGAVIAAIATPAALAATGQIDSPEVFKSDTDPPVYGFSPLNDLKPGVLDAISRETSESGSITTGEIEYCEQTEQMGRIGPFCEMTLTAYRDGNLAPVDGPINPIEVRCSPGIELLPPEHCTRGSGESLNPDD